jgi:hypothetical protein
MNRTLIAASLFSFAMIAGCDTSRSSRPNAESVDSVEMDLDLAPGIIINSASYTIAGPGGFSRTGALDVSHSTKLSALIAGLPAGKGFTITVTATSTDGNATCVGSANFDVFTHTISQVSVHLTCHEGPRTGGALINGTLNVCPTIDGVSAAPAEVLVGGTVALGAMAHDSDAAPAALTYAWTASSGTLSSSTDPSPTFTCTAPGTATLTLTVSDGDATPGCDATQTVQVTCTQLFSQACQACVTANCSGLLCDNLTGTALEGPATGRSKAQLCNDTVACVISSHCGASDLSSCVCGTVPGNACVDDGAGNGPCKDVSDRAFEAVQALDVPVRFSDTSFAGGVAMSLLQCASDNCAGCL